MEHLRRATSFTKAKKPLVANTASSGATPPIEIKRRTASGSGTPPSMGTIYETPETSDELPSPYITNMFVIKILAMMISRWVTELRRSFVRVCIDGKLYAFSSSAHPNKEVVSITHVTHGQYMDASMHINAMPITIPALRGLSAGDICSIDLDDMSAIWINGIKTEITSSMLL